jgi:hypothetical protein
MTAKRPMLRLVPMPPPEPARDEGRQLGAALLARDPLRAEHQAVAP